MGIDSWQPISEGPSTPMSGIESSFAHGRKQLLKSNTGRPMKNVSISEESCRFQTDERDRRSIRNPTHQRNLSFQVLILVVGGLKLMILVG